jgi:predicted nuclease with TOPRIM domain
MGIFYSKKDNIILEEVAPTPSPNINKLLLNDNEMQNKYDRIKNERESYKKRIHYLENSVDKLINKVQNLEINERQNYTKEKRKWNTMNQLYDRIVMVETELKEGIILKVPENNRPFLEPKKKH